MERGSLKAAVRVAAHKVGEPQWGGEESPAAGELTAGGHWEDGPPGPHDGPLRLFAGLHFQLAVKERLRHRE